MSYIDLSVKKKVSVIASFNEKGDCVPLYFRYVFHDGSYTDIQIERIIETRRAAPHTFYTCYVTTYDIRRKIDLVHHRDEGTWTLNAF